MLKPQNKLKLFPYNPDYPKKFDKYQKQIFQSLKDYKVEAHHIGSTAVVGLGGKGFVDILIGLLSWNQKNEIIDKLKSLGFTHIHPKENDRIFLSKPPEDIKNYDVHLHLVIIGSKPYKEIIYFRNYMRNNPQKAKEYFDLKLSLLRSTKENREKYTYRKAKFIEQICNQINNLSWKEVWDKFEQDLSGKLKNLPDHRNIKPHLSGFRSIISHELPETTSKITFQKLIKILLQDKSVDVKSIKQKFLLPELEKENQIISKFEKEYRDLTKSAMRWINTNISEEELKRLWIDHKTWLPRRSAAPKNSDLSFQKISADTLARFYLIKTMNKE